MKYKKIKFNKQDKIATITLNDPETRNAITNLVLLEEVKDALRSIEHDQDVSVCILTGEGKGFSSGGNVKDMLNRENMFSGDGLELQNNYRNGIHSLSKLMYSFEIPMIAAVNGAAAGAGVDLALLCDLRIGSENATFASSFINLAVIPGDGAAWLLRKTVGAQRAAEMVLTGRTVDANEALEMGMLLKVVKPEALMASALEIAKEIASKSRETLIITKRLLKSTDTLGYEDHLNLCSANQGMLHQAPAHDEAMKAFFNKRK